MSIQSFFQGGLQIGVMVLLLVIFVTIGAIIFFLYKKWKRYQEFRCVIYPIGKITEDYDRAGIFVDKKTGNKRFFMMKNNVGLEPDNVPFRVSGKKKIVYLVQDGLKNFRFININTLDTEPDVSIGEEDVNWAINSYERQKKMFQPSTLLQYMPFIALAFVSIVILIIFIYFFKDFAVLKDVAINLKEASLSCSGQTIVK